jgi:LmbE family N-acetylglucosaminyl deacetylase
MLRASVAMSVIFFSTSAFARPLDAAHLQRAWQRLGVVGRVLYVAAHPDDENTRLLGWLANEKRLRAGYLSLTRGEGGQNLIGSEQAPLLGVIRTEELLAARGVDGAEQWFGLERDFGYSKNPEETLGIWDHDAALGDVVWAIRRFRPDVMVTRFSPELRDTHGHHTASAMLAVEAFKAAADPKAYPEQLKWVQPWQAKRIVWNKGVWPGMPAGDLTGFVTVDVGGYDPVLGMSYGEMAAKSRSMHKSQGFGASPSRGPAPEYFKLLAGEPMQKSFLDGVDTSWKRVKGSENVQAALAKVAFDAAHPATAIPALLEVLDAVNALPDDPVKEEKRADLMELIAGCAGVYAEAVADDYVVMPGGERKVTVSVVNRSPAALTLREVKLGGEAFPVEKALVSNQPLELVRNVRVPVTTSLSNPYWLDEPPSAGRWTVRDQKMVGLPVAPPPVIAELAFELNGRSLSLARAVDFAWNDPVAGERRRALDVVPPVTVEPLDPLVVIADGHARPIQVKLTATVGPVDGELEGAAFDLKKKGDETTVTLTQAPDSLETPLIASRREAPMSRTSIRRIEYPHIPIVTVQPLAELRRVHLHLNRGGVKHVGYIAGAGDEVAMALRQAGYEVTALSDEALAHESLARFDAIVIGVRAFNVNSKLFVLHQRLMDYVAAGGTLVAQYNTQNRMSKIAGDIGPYPFNISQDRVTEENATAEMAENAVFKAPNLISKEDFAGWIQERGLYFADHWDEHYQAPLAMHDAGEPARKGGLLIAHFGKGKFVYTGLAFFRQLPGGVPGAFRLFANLLAHGK